MHRRGAVFKFHLERRRESLCAHRPSPSPPPPSRHQQQPQCTPGVPQANHSTAPVSVAMPQSVSAPVATPVGLLLRRTLGPGDLWGWTVCGRPRAMDVGTGTASPSWGDTLGRATGHPPAPPLSPRGPLLPRALLLPRPPPPPWGSPMRSGEKRCVDSKPSLALPFRSRTHGVGRSLPPYPAPPPFSAKKKKKKIEQQTTTQSGSDCTVTLLLGG